MREHYSTAIPYTGRHTYSHHGNIQHTSTSPHSPLSTMSRSLDSSVSQDSPSSSGQFHLATSQMQLDTSTSYPLSSQNAPPFEATKHFHALSDTGGTPIHPDIQAKLDKGFFKADQDWTCYRRNYFTVACCYSLKPDVDHVSEPIYLNRNNGSRDRVHSFAICISAKADGEEERRSILFNTLPKETKVR